MVVSRVRFVDTTFRDGSQSLWAMGMRHGMMEAIASDMDRVGFDVIEVPGNAIHFKKIVRDLKEDPWAMMRMLAQAMPRTPKSCMGGGLNLNSFGTPTPPVLGQLFWKHMVEIGVLNRVQLTANTADQLKRGFRTYIPFCKSIGLQVAIALSYSISPRHTDEHYADKTRQALSFKPDVIYLKDQGGLLTVDRLRTLLPTIIDNAGDTPLEVHSHATTGLAPLVYLEALKLGVPTIHTGVPPLADGSAQPSVISLAKNVRLLGYSHRLDEELLGAISERLTAIAKQDDMPLGAPLHYDEAQYIHQIPGGVISNLKYQLADIRLSERLDEVVEECVRIRHDLGYPVMITPYSQYIGTQAALNVATGTRYGVVLDEILRFAQGAYGEDSGYTWMDQELRDRLVSLPRARELAALDRQPIEDVSLADIRARLGGADVSDEELLLRAIMQGTREIEDMRRAGPPRQYLDNSLPLLTLLQELGKEQNVAYIKIERGGDSIVVQNRAAGAA